MNVNNIVRQELGRYPNQDLGAYPVQPLGDLQHEPRKLENEDEAG